MKRNQATSIILNALILFVLSLLFSSLVYGQEEAVAEKDRKFYIYSIDQLNSANQGLQEQLAENEKLINRLRAEIDSLRQVAMDLQLKLDRGVVTASPLTPATAMSKAEEPEKTKAKAKPLEKAVSKTDLEDSYRKALEKFNQKDYKQAIAMFQSLIESDRNHALADNSQYWIGECYYGLKDYQKAIIEFEKVFSFTNTNKSDDAQLKLGLCYIRLNDKESAKRELTRLLSNYPNSEFTELARKLLREL